MFLPPSKRTIMMDGSCDVWVSRSGVRRRIPRPRGTIPFSVDRIISRTGFSADRLGGSPSSGRMQMDGGDPKRSRTTCDPMAPPIGKRPIVREIFGSRGILALQARRDRDRDLVYHGISSCQGRGRRAIASKIPMIRGIRMASEHPAQKGRNASLDRAAWRPTSLMMRRPSISRSTGSQILPGNAMRSPSSLPDASLEFRWNLCDLQGGMGRVVHVSSRDRCMEDLRRGIVAWKI